MKLVGYIRVSSDSQADNTSLPEQRNKITSYCQAFDHELVAVMEEVGSGTKSTRPEFNKAIEMMRRGEADGIIVAKLDRLARNTRTVLTLIEDVIQPLNKSLIILDLGVDTSTPIGKMILTVMAAVATLERDLINERTQGGRKAKAMKGGYAYGAPMYGMRAVEGELVIDQAEQEIITTMRRHRRSGKSYHSIADWLNAQSIPSKTGGQWHGASVKAVLDRAKLTYKTM